MFFEHCGNGMKCPAKWLSTPGPGGHGTGLPIDLIN